MKTFTDYGIDIGTKMGEEIKCLCPKCSMTRRKKNYPCLNVNREKGVWNCWHCGWSGSLKTGEWQRAEIVKAYVKPTFIKAVPKDDMLQWFNNRGITRTVVERNGITKGMIYFPQVEEELPALQFPYFRGGEVVNIKYRSKEKYFRMAAGAERVLYGLNDITETLIWVEGEIDKLSVEVGGFTSCVSVPDGAPAPETKDYSNKFDYLQDKALEKVKTHIIAVDNDGPGVRLQEELVRRLGAEKCLLVTWPEGCKDANEVLTKYGRERVAECLADAQPMPILGTHAVSDLAEQLNNEYVHGAPRGLEIGWRDLNDLYRVMPGEMTIVTGIPGDGKSEWLDALTMNLAKMYGWTFGVFSPENQPLTHHAARLAEKYVGKPFNTGPHERMSKEELQDAQSWLNAHYTFICPELPSVDELLDIARQLVLRKGIRGLVIDPWNEIDHSRAEGLSETEHISRCLSKIRIFGRNSGVHVWVVAHPAKPKKELDGSYPVPTPYDIAGSANWRNKADNCIAIYRDQVAANPEVQIHIQKIKKKANGRIGMAVLRYDRMTGQYRDDAPGYMPKQFAAKHAGEK